MVLVDERLSALFLLSLITRTFHTHHVFHH